VAFAGFNTSGAGLVACSVELITTTEGVLFKEFPFVVVA
jgi:hypothetical protein